MPGWSKPHTHSNPTNLALFRHKITPYRYNQGEGAHAIAGGSNGSRGLSPLAPFTLTTARVYEAFISNEPTLSSSSFYGSQWGLRVFGCWNLHAIVNVKV